jgi:hypothetical protein
VGKRGTAGMIEILQELADSLEYFRRFHPTGIILVMGYLNKTPNIKAILGMTV